MKMIIIILIALINIPLAWHGDITYLMYLAGVLLMLKIWRQIIDILQNI